MSLLQQICLSPNTADVRKTFKFPEKSLDKDAMKTTEEDHVSQEKSLVPNNPALETISKTTTSKTLSSSPTGYGGLINLALMMGVVTLLKLLLGLCVNVTGDAPPVATLIPNISIPALPILVFPVFAMLLSYRVELLISKNKVSWENALPCHLATLAMGLTIPVVLLRRQDNLDDLNVNLLLCFSYLIFSMKLLSYIQVNKRYRARQIERNNNVKDDYPENLTLGNIVRFWLSPTLVYQPNESCSPSINVKVVLQRVLELCVLQLGVRQVTLVIPNVVSGLLEAANNEDVLLVIERFLTLSLAFNFVWMLSFYLMFISFLQLIAEVTQAQERKFFHSWWNASSMEEFWRWWNLPVHRWCVKHIYVPLVKHRWSKRNAMLAVFITSAFLHEYLISCPIQIAGHFAFVGFLGQLPIMKITEVVMNKCGGRVGNFVVWGLLVFGNAWGVVVYYKEVVDSTRIELEILA